ncbi:resuscitation-promoting factor [Streptomyces sp. NRRL S-118]|uniref:resuscitation-promoting factor n=1 Tax=Streptomyces sp. NRRL S-118 TaxID=1463881 RepID=UPI000A470129|nr:resuscitation-promoting factor [Streptomyces sp. NRRL S-118]
MDNTPARHRAPVAAPAPAPQGPADGGHGREAYPYEALPLGTALADPDAATLPAALLPGGGWVQDPGLATLVAGGSAGTTAAWPAGEYLPSGPGAAFAGPPRDPAGLAAPAAPTVELPPAGPAGGRAQARRAARRRAFGPGGDGLRRLVPQALVVAFLAGGTSAFVASDKAVRLSVDGAPRTLHTFADDVAELLADEGLAVGGHDLVTPGPRQALASGDEVVVRYGRPLALALDDGQRRRVWTTARTVEEALRGFGVRAEGAYLSVPRAAPIPRTGLTLDVRTERTVTFMADGRERTIRTNAATVREAVEQAGIVLSGQDTTSVPPGSFPRDGQTITVLRITATREVREELIPYAVERVRDPGLFTGTEVVERQGRSGARRVTYALRTVNGVRQTPRKIAEEVVRDPVTQLVKVGTKPLPASVAGADDLDWDALARCESGGRPDAVDASGTYGGLYQFDPGTWQALGGRGVPQDAPAQEQTYRAKKLYVQRGSSPWPHCGRRLYR